MIYILITSAIVLAIAIDIHYRLKVEDPEHWHLVATIIRPGDRKLADFIDAWPHRSTIYKLRVILKIYLSTWLGRFRR